jgi:hypothetical protein
LAIDSSADARLKISRQSTSAARQPALALASAYVPIVAVAEAYACIDTARSKTSEWGDGDQKTDRSRKL